MIAQIRRMPLSQMACWLCLYLATGALSGQFNVNTTADAPYIWLPAGVSLAAILLSRTNSGVTLAIAFGLLQVLLSHLGGRDVLSALALGALAGVAPLIAATIVRWMRVPLEGLRLLYVVVVAALISAVLLGVGGAVLFGLTKGKPILQPMLAWSAAIFVGVCITLPLLVVWAQFQTKRSVQRRLGRELVGYASFAAMVGLTWWLFDSPTKQWYDAVGVACPLYLPVFCVVIVTLVGGARGGTLAVLALTLICLGHTANGDGPFASQTAPVSLTLLQAQLYIGVSAMLVLIVHALRAAEAHAYDEADHWRTDLELALSGGAMIAYMVDPATRKVQWRGDVHRVTGYSAESLSTADDVLACVHPLDRERVRARWSGNEFVAGSGPAHLPFRLSRAVAADGWIELVDNGSSLSSGNGHTAFVAGVWQNQPSSVS
jgi:hypothetical protein